MSLTTKRNLTKRLASRLLVALLLGGSAPAALAQSNPDTNIGYQRPPETIASIIEAPNTPNVSISEGEWMLLLESPGYPGIDEVAAAESRLAGMRINPATNGPSRGYYYNSLKLKKISNGDEFQVKGLPQNAKISNISWSPDEKHVAFTHTAANGIELWLADLGSKTARKLTNAVLNDVYGRPFDWFSDSKTLVVKFVDEQRGDMPQAPTVPAGPTIQQNIGKAKPSRTYQDLLKNRYDEQLFDYYMQTQLKLVSVDGSQQPIGEAGIIKSAETSPDGQYLLVETILKPYSYLVPHYYFPYKVEVWNRNGQLVKELAKLPLAEDIPIAFDAVAKGPRNYSWRPDKPATLYWAEAQDGGDANKEARVRDHVYMQAAPFTGKPTQIAATKYRYRGMMWGEDMAIVNERWWKTRQERSTLIDPTKPGKAGTVLIDRSYEDNYSDPGSPVFAKNNYGRSVLLTDKKKQHIYMISEGGSPEGNRPFVSAFNLKSKKADILWRSEAPYYERPVDILDLKEQKIITRRESENDPPNYFVRDIDDKKLAQVTTFPHPNPQLEGVQKQLLQYKRADGVNLTATLYLPKDFKKGDAPLPMLLWAYPREFKSADAAGQVKGSPYEFTRISYGSPLFWVTQGYAILDRTDIPIVGEGNAQPNDTYVQQLVASAKAAIDEVVEMGVVDPKRVAVGGHSYGAFMTGNLLAHSDLFAAGIARSGAYNRTLTPFGFQAEERTYWDAPEVYFQMSPFSFANKVNEPILLIHGEADNNSGTFPIQSERFYNALKGHGATTRLVFLPAESHGYRAKESILHMLWEMDQWLDRYVKNRPVQ